MEGMEEIQLQASLAVASSMVDAVHAEREAAASASPRTPHRFPPFVVRAVIFVQAAIRRWRFVRDFGDELDNDLAEPPPRPRMALALHFLRRARNPHWVDVSNEANAVAGIVAVKEQGLAMGDVEEVVRYYEGLVPEGHLSLTILTEKLNELVVQAEENLQIETEQLETPAQIQVAIGRCCRANKVPKHLEGQVLCGATRRMREVVAEKEKELRRDLNKVATVPEMDVVRSHVEKDFGPVPTALRDELDVARTRRVQFLEQELETRWSRPFAGPLPPHSRAARRYELELGAQHPKVVDFVLEERRHASQLEATLEVELGSLQARMKELTKKRKEARARTLVEDIDEQLMELTLQVQNAIEEAIEQLGGENKKVRQRAQDLLSVDARTAVYAIQAENAAEELRLELQEDVGPEATDRRRAAAANLEALLDALSSEHHLQAELRSEFAEQFREVAEARAAASTASSPDDPSQLEAAPPDAPPRRPIGKSPMDEDPFGEAGLDKLTPDMVGHPGTLPEKSTFRDAAGPEIEQPEPEDDDEDGWGAPAGFTAVESFVPEVVKMRESLPNGGLPDVGLPGDGSETQHQHDQDFEPDMDTMMLMSAINGDVQPQKVKSRRVTAQLVLKDLKMDIVELHTEPVFAAKFTKALADALQIPRQRIKVTGFAPGSVKVLFTISEPLAGEVGVDSDTPLAADMSLAELTQQVSDPGSRFRLSEVGPFVTNAQIEEGGA